MISATTWWSSIDKEINSNSSREEVTKTLTTGRIFVSHIPCYDIVSYYLSLFTHNLQQSVTFYHWTNFKIQQPKRGLLHCLYFLCFLIIKDPSYRIYRKGKAILYWWKSLPKFQKSIQHFLNLCFMNWNKQVELSEYEMVFWFMRKMWRFV